MPAGPSAVRFAVIVCPSCRHAKGVDRGAATTTCGRCGARHATKGLRAFYETDDAEALRAAVGVVEARLMGGEEGLIDVRELAEEIDARRGVNRKRAAPAADADEAEIIQHAAAAAAGIVSMQKRADAIMDALDASRPDGFSEERLTRAFVAAGMPAERAGKEIKRAFLQDELYEPRPGRYKRFLG